MMGLQAKPKTAPAHTAGPWFVDQIGNGRTGPDSEFQQIIYFDKFASLAVVRRGAEDEEYGDDNTVRANARLIAAAPELLLEIERALMEFRDKECNCDADQDGDRMVGHACYFHRIEPGLRSVIAKATGSAT